MYAILIYSQWKWENTRYKQKSQDVIYTSQNDQFIYTELFLVVLRGGAELVGILRLSLVEFAELSQVRINFTGKVIIRIESAVIRSTTIRSAFEMFPFSRCFYSI